MGYGLNVDGLMATRQWPNTSGTDTIVALIGLAAFSRRLVELFMECAMFGVLSKPLPGYGTALAPSVRRTGHLLFIAGRTEYGLGVSDG